MKVKLDVKILCFSENPDLHSYHTIGISPRFLNTSLRFRCILDWIFASYCNENTVYKDKA